MATSASIIAATFATDTADVRGARYQPTRTKLPVYTFGDRYFCCARKQPTECGLRWSRHSDQFFASGAGTILWVATPEGEAE